MRLLWRTRTGLFINLARQYSGAVVWDRVPDRLEIVGRVKFRSIPAPRGLFDDPVRVAQLLGRHAQDDELADAHHHVPGYDFDPGGRKLVVPAGPSQVLVYLVDRFCLIVP